MQPDSIYVTDSASVRATQETPRTNNIKCFFQNNTFKKTTDYDYKLLPQRTIAHFSGSKSKLTNSLDLPRASELIERLRSYPQDICMKGDDFFFKDYLELYHLVNDDYKYLFIEEVNNKRKHMLCFNKYSTRIINSTKINEALLADNNMLCMKITDYILKERTTKGIVSIDSILSYLMLLEKNICEGDTSYDTDNGIDFFDIYINKSFLLLILFVYNYGKEFHYIINSKYFPTNININKNHLPKNILNMFPSLAYADDYLLTEIILNVNEIEGIDLDFIKNNGGYIDRNIIMSLLNMRKSITKDYSCYIKPEILLSIIENIPEQCFFDLPWNYSNLQMILCLHKNPLENRLQTVLQYITNIANKNKRHQMYFLLYKVFKFVRIDNLKQDSSFMQIKDQFVNLFSLLTTENFKNNKLEINFLIFKLIMPILLDFDNEIIELAKFPINMIINENIIFIMLVKLEEKESEYLFFIRQYNFSIIQFITYAINSKNKNLTKQAIKVYNKYLQLDIIENSTSFYNIIQSSCDFSETVSWILTGEYYALKNSS